jgi:hypothetical protein
MNEQLNRHSSECNRKSTLNDVKLKWLTQPTKLLDEFYLDKVIDLPVTKLYPNDKTPFSMFVNTTFF